MLLLLVTLSSMLLAAIMTAIAWRVSHDERRRSDARVAALAAEIHGGATVKTVPDLPIRRARESTAVAAAPARVPAAPVHMFESPTAYATGSRFGVVAAAGVLVVAGVAAAVVVFSGSRGTATAASGAAAPNAATAIEPLSGVNSANTAAREPLELVALGHERDGNQLIVRGIVRNPASGVEVDKLTAVVFLFGRDGGFLTSGRAAVASPVLSPGGESTFLVTVPDAADVTRYRVSFRTDDQIVPHVDRRERPQEKG